MCTLIMDQPEAGRTYSWVQSGGAAGLADGASLVSAASLAMRTRQGGVSRLGDFVLTVSETQKPKTQAVPEA